MIRRPRRREASLSRPGVIRGAARVDTRTKNLVARLQPGEIAIINHEDVDRMAAESIIRRQAGAVVNAARSASGRYPNLGPLMLVSAGIPVIDEAGTAVMAIPDGAIVSIDGSRILRADVNGGEEIASGHLLTLEGIEKTLDHSKQNIAFEIERFAENTIGYIKEERDVILEAARLPDVATDFHGRHVLVVVRGHGYREDLKTLRPYIREVRPLLVGVDGGADALAEVGLSPDMIIGDMDSVTTEGLLSGAELVVHAYPGGTAPGLERIAALGLDCVVFEATGTSEDISMLLAFERGAELIVAVGTHANLVEFLDKGRKGMASTFLTRLRVGPILVDAKGVSRLYRTRVRGRDLTLLVGAAVATMAIAVGLSEPMRLLLGSYLAELENWWFQVKEALFS